MDVQKCLLLLESLRVLPEEFFSANLTQYKRSVLRHELTKGLPDVLELLKELMNPNSPADVYDHSLRCFSSWVEFGVPLMEGEPVIVQVFNSLHNEALFDTAVDTLVNVFSHPDAHRFPYTIQKLLPHVLQLQTMFQKASEASNMDICQGLSQIIVAVAENHTKLIVESSICQEEGRRQNSMNLLQMVLACSSLPGHYPVDENSSNMPFTFWYLLQDDILASDAEKYRLLLPLYQPVFFSLIEILLIKVQYPPEEEYETWTAEEKEQFRCYRQDIGDTMMYSFSILREPLLGHLCSVLAGAVENSKITDLRWQVIEGIFFLFGSVAESVDLEENAYLPTLLSLLPKIPCSNVKFISTALYMIGSFGEWINCHPESLTSVIPLILQGLGNAEVATAATMSLKDVTRENLDHIQPYVNQIFTASKNALDGNILKARERIRLMSALGQVLSVLPFDDIMQYLNTLLTPVIQELGQLVKQEPTPAVRANISLKLNMLSWMVASLDTDRPTSENMEGQKQQEVKLDQPKPVFLVMQQVAPIVQELLSKWMNDASIVELVCELFKRSLRTLMDDFAPMATDTAQMLIQMYQTVPHAVILDLSKQLILLFSTDERFFSTLKVLLNSLCDKTLELYQKGLQNYTDVIEGFMNLMAQVLKKTKPLLADGTYNIPGLFQAGVQALALPEQHTVKAACSFLNEFLSVGSELPALKQVVNSDGHLLVDRILRAIGGESPRGVVDSLSDVLNALNKFYVEQTSKCMNDIIQTEGYPSNRVTLSDKEYFVKMVLRERGNKRKHREIVKEFALKCRGLYGTEYAAQISAIV
ncbi:hypothetical protein KUTeg_016177 [Tegillarca granosa]|uniref:Importin-13 n=1 Tax=Tegillarca granosa TaxID=220873 RepID=A0ABQ9EK40_TEGGR|nr:hypothetical protein KUTeg_016177 [Tegillarca granosa]